MTGWGDKISDVPLEDLKSTLAETDDDGKAVKRLVVAIAYKQGHSPTDIEETFGFDRNTVYQWLDRFEERGIEEAIYDETRPGRPPKLTGAQLDALEKTVQEPPESAGFDAPEWSPALVRNWLDRRFDVRYTRRHARRLLNDARSATNDEQSRASNTV